MDRLVEGSAFSGKFRERARCFWSRGNARLSSGVAFGNRTERRECARLQRSGRRHPDGGRGGRVGSRTSGTRRAQRTATKRNPNAQRAPATKGSTGQRPSSKTASRGQTPDRLTGLCFHFKCRKGGNCDECFEISCGEWDGFPRPIGYSGDHFPFVVKTPHSPSIRPVVLR